MVSQRDKDEFARLLEPVHVAAMRFARRLCTTREDAEDLYHDAVLGAWHGLTGLRDRGQFKPWFFRILVNSYRNRQRRARWRRVFMPDRGGLPADGEEATASTDPRGVLDARRWIERGMRALSAEDRALVILFEIEQSTIAEIAQIWKAPEGTIKSRLSRARARMRAAIMSEIPSPAASSREKATAASRTQSEVDYELRPSQAMPE